MSLHGCFPLLPLNINKAQVANYLNEIKEIKEAEIVNASQDKEIIVPTGKYLQTDLYTTIQNDFPETYGIGKTGLSSKATTARK